MKTGCVLVVDDDADVCEDLAFLIEHQGYRVVTAQHGEAALAKLALVDKPCIILLDLMMPVMDGWEMQRRLAADPRLKDIPVVVVSGVADLGARPRAPQVVASLKKPIDLPQLYRLLSAHCSAA